MCYLCCSLIYGRVLSGGNFSIWFLITAVAVSWSLSVIGLRSEFLHCATSTSRQFFHEPSRCRYSPTSTRAVSVEPPACLGTGSSSRSRSAAAAGLLLLLMMVMMMMCSERMEMGGHLEVEILSTGRFYVGAGGHVTPRFTCCPHPQIQKLADRSDVISEVPKCSKIQIFRWGSASWWRGWWGQCAPEFLGYNRPCLSTAFIRKNFWEEFLITASNKVMFCLGF